MKKGLILMLMISLLGHIAAAGMLYVAGAYGVWDEHPRNGIDDQTGDVVRVLWGFTEEIQMSIQGTKEHDPPPPLMGGGEGEGEQRGLAPLPLVPSHEGRGNKERVFSDETFMSQQITKDNENTLPVDWKSGGRDKGGDGVFSSETLTPRRATNDHENVIPAEAGIQSAGKGLDSHFRGNDGHAEGFSDEAGGNQDPSGPSMLSLGAAGECSSSAACMGINVAASEVYPGIGEAGSHGGGGEGGGLKTFLEALRAEIERRKTYPPFARMNGIEGTAYLNFHIGDNGRPDGIIIERSSGSKILDESAIRTLKGMERFYPVPDEIRELEITVPIAYRLVEDAEKINR